MRWGNLLAVGMFGMLLAACQTTPNPDALTAADAIAKPTASSAMPQGTPANDPPPGFVSFCLRFADQCSSAPNEAASIVLTPKLWTELNAVNRSVNDAIWPESDSAHFDRAEYWTIPADGYGNCHDYALVKRQLLAKSGLPLRALRIAIVVTGRNNRHAVLTISTGSGDFVLDNLTDEIVPWNKTGYTWLARQDGHSDWGWVALDGTPTRLAEANPPHPAKLD